MVSSQLTMSEHKNYIVEPYKFILWLFILTVIMIFGGLTSAYIAQMSVIQPQYRILFQLPNSLWTNLALLLFSSVTLQIGFWMTKRGEQTKALVALGFTFLLGIAFLWGQLDAMQQMAVDARLPLVDDQRRDNLVSFFYVFVALHGFHLIAGLVTLLVVGLRSATKKVWAKRLNNMEIATTFWHFLGILWVYLFVFLLYTQQ